MRAAKRVAAWGLLFIGLLLAGGGVWLLQSGKSLRFTASDSSECETCPK